MTLLQPAGIFRHSILEIKQLLEVFWQCQSHRRVVHDRQSSEWPRSFEEIVSEPSESCPQAVVMKDINQELYRSRSLCASVPCSTDPQELFPRVQWNNRQKHLIFCCFKSSSVEVLGYVRSFKTCVVAECQLWSGPGYKFLWHHIPICLWETKDTAYKNSETEERWSLLKESCPGGFKIILSFCVEQLSVITMHVSEVKS